MNRKTARKINFTDCKKRADYLSNPEGQCYSGMLCRNKDLDRIVFLVNHHERHLKEIEKLTQENKRLQKENEELKKLTQKLQKEIEELNSMRDNADFMRLLRGYIYE